MQMRNNVLVWVVVVMLGMAQNAFAACPQDMNPALCKLAGSTGGKLKEGASPEEIQQFLQKNVSKIQDLKDKQHTAKVIEVQESEASARSWADFLKQKGSYIPLGLLLLVVVAYVIDTHKLLFVMLFSLLNVASPLIYMAQKWLGKTEVSPVMNEVTLLGHLGWKGILTILAVSMVVSAFTRSIITLILVAACVYIYSQYALYMH